MIQQSKPTKIEQLEAALSIATEVTDKALKAEQETKIQSEEIQLKIEKLVLKRKNAEAAEAEAKKQIDQARETIKRVTDEAQTAEQEWVKVKRLLNQKTSEREILEAEESRISHEKETEV